MFYFFEELGSTIDEARDDRYLHGDIIVAQYQTAGRGQRGNRWSSRRGENLMLSAVLDTRLLLVTEQFMLLQAVALALTDMFARYALDTRIKWTNDIYIGDRKVAGVLIDHTIKDGRLFRSGVGIGINVNQTQFETWIPNPTSMRIELGYELDKGEMLERFHLCLMERYEMLGEGRHEELQADYRTKIYRLDTPARYILPDGKEFIGIIRGVKPDGSLMIEGENGIRSYLFNEVKFII